MDSTLAPTSAPIAQQKSPRPDPCKVERPVLGKTERSQVLVVDDEARIRLALRACLEAEGYAVTEAADGLEAIEAVGNNPPALIILDLAMPRLNGLATARQLKTMLGPRMPRIIVLTAYGSTHSQAYAQDCGVCAFLEKPLLPDALRQIVEQVLHHPA
jgi:two-component system, OmpR family, response regulator MprA